MSTLSTLTEPLQLTDLAVAARWHNPRRFARIDTWRQALYLALVVARELLVAAPRDVARACRRHAEPRLRLEPGQHHDAAATRIALYVHYSASGRISEMVLRQLAMIGELGFSVVFISMADHVSEADWQAVRQVTALVGQRPNFGLDFGAWRDLMPEVRRHWSIPQELLLANDSVLGPIHPLVPLIAMMRAAGEGLFGLTESLQGGPHLQSYMLLARGPRAVEDLMHFVQTLYISHSKWILVRMGEVRLSRWMRRRGHRVAALFGYQRVVKALMADPEERSRLSALYRRFNTLDRASAEAAVAALNRWPVNPTHHLWLSLATRFGFPFLKTELIRTNPVRLPGVAAWQAVVPDDSPCPLLVIQDHLNLLQVALSQEVRAP